jgi:zinc protease
MIIVGDIDTDEGLRLIDEALGKWQGKQTSAAVSNTGESRTTRALGGGCQVRCRPAELRLGHLGVSRIAPDYFSVVVMNALLGGLFSSRINLNLRERHGVYIRCFVVLRLATGTRPIRDLYAVQSEVSADALRETLAEIDGMRREEVSADELSLATSYLEGVFPIRYETTSAIASALATLVTFGLPEDFYDTYRDNIRAVSPSDVLKAARRHVHRKSCRQWSSETQP